MSHGDTRKKKNEIHEQFAVPAKQPKGAITVKNKIKSRVNKTSKMWWRSDTKKVSGKGTGGREVDTKVE